ncbi:hypothetical protein F2Q69_00048570 [Brassica cretica]|uniref:Uncharacterized protein n=1 Tax=Brassica cretica TaxID=69181 RepID=A0A8S9PSE8_BRACR|nr:hypothetical protein F2Q69_00048570 [Brassica cretica]
MARPRATLESLHVSLESRCGEVKLGFCAGSERFDVAGRSWSRPCVDETIQGISQATAAAYGGCEEPHFQYQNNYQQKPFYNNQQGSYQASQNYSQGFSSKGNQSTQGQAGSSTPDPQESSTDAMLKQILESQTRSEKHIGYELQNLHTKVDGSYNDLNNKFSNLASNFKALEDQFTSLTSTSKRPIGSLQGKSEQHPKEYCNAILSTTSEMLLSDHRKEVNELERLMYGTEVVAKAEAQIVEKVGHRVEANIVTRAEHKAEKPVIENVVKKLKEAQKKVISKFRKDMGDVGVKLPQITNMHDAHVQMMLIKDILAHKEEVGELLDISTMQLDPPLTPKSLPKLETLRRSEDGVRGGASGGDGDIDAMEVEQRLVVTEA